MDDPGELAELRAEVAELRAAVQYLLKQEVKRQPQINLRDGEFRAPRMVYEALGVPYEEEPRGQQCMMVINCEAVREQEHRGPGCGWDDEIDYGAFLDDEDWG